MNEHLDPYYEASKWPLAAFLIPNQGANFPDFVEFSRAFWLSHKNLLTEGAGLIVQTTTLSENGLTEGPPTETLIFDARDQTNDTYCWEVTNAHSIKEGRNIKQVRVSSEEITGHIFQLNRQGIGASEYTMDTEDLAKTLHHISRILDSSASREQIAKRHRVKEQLAATLAKFAIDRTVSIEIACRAWKIDTTIKEVKLAGKRYEKEYETRAKAAQKFGFVVLKPYENSHYAVQLQLAITGQARVLNKSRNKQGMRLCQSASPSNNYIQPTLF